MSALLERLTAMRAELVDTMTAGLDADPPSWSEWLPLLAQVEISVRAVRTVETERDGSP